MKKAKLIFLAGLAMAVSLTGCQKKEVKPGDVAGYDEGEQYLSIWVHSIEDTPEGQVYRESVDSFKRNIMVNILQILNLFLETTVVAAIQIR